MPEIGKGHYLAPENVNYDPVLVKKAELKPVTELTGWPPGSWFLSYGVKRHKRALSRADMDAGLPEYMEEVLVLRESGTGDLGTQGKIRFWTSEKAAQEFLASLEDYKPPKADPPPPPPPPPPPLADPPKAEKPGK
jgi:hypothetical protein